MSASLPPALPGSGSALQPYAPAGGAPVVYRDPGAGEQAGGGELARILSALNRFKWLVVGILVAGTVAGVLATRLLTPEYQVQSTLLLTSSGGSESRGPLRDDALLDAQGWKDLLKAYSIADSVVMQLALYLQPARAADSVVFRGFQLNRGRFYPGDYTLEVEGARWTLSDKVGVIREEGVVGDSVGRRAGFYWRPTKAVLGDDRTVKFQVRIPREASNDILKRLSVDLREGSNLIALSLSGTPQQKPAETLNAWGEQFVRIAGDLKTARMSQYVRILTAQRAEAEQRLRDAEFQLTRYRTQVITLPSEGLAMKPGATSGGIELREPVFDQYFKDRYELQTVQRDLQALDRAIASVTPTSVPIEGLLTIPTVAGDPGAMTLRESLNELAKRQTELRVLRERFTDSNKVVRDQLYGLEQLQTRAIPEQLRAFRTELARRQSTVNTTIAKATSELQGIPQRSIQQEALRRELDNATQLYLSLQARSAEAELSEKSAIPDVRILDQAVMPLEPSKNTAPRIILMAIGGSVALGLALAFLLDRTDRRFRYPSQATGDLGLQILGVVPEVEQGRHVSPEKVAGVVEAFRELRMNVKYSCMPNQKVTLAVTSPGPGDGKSLVASNLALSFAEGGWRTVLVDADLRRGFLNETFAQPSTPGLIEYLEGTSPLAEVQRTTHHANLTLIPGGTRHRRAPELLATPRMQELVAALSRDFDAIIVDTPPLGAGSDAYALATATTNVAIVLRGGTTDVRMAKAKLETLDRLPVAVIGAILNGVQTTDGIYQYYSYDTKYAITAGEEVEPAGAVGRLGDGR
ncbi:polysaccharide biosynthesis tyrosine autokinase [Roseisolibacter sp. H3M3-2]|uniref:polysaccharide biosynthesis tyrosine autokinase n=1 Tax=Roseisolibacter sp. H3M3-2 TaxID=3031323 RepID=UPI0023DA4358|nr:polysaccharide biosynthesis tyrosine autokinase [Roseisolibacter sp. H3M3-2]MDF1502857.1 polysaccharide biosynthesis tyrosine autokinase [Roseisolibacter sp. H3M3-2]